MSRTRNPISRVRESEKLYQRKLPNRRRRIEKVSQDRDFEKVVEEVMEASAETRKHLAKN